MHQIVKRFGNAAAGLTAFAIMTGVTTQPGSAQTGCEGKSNCVIIGASRPLTPEELERSRRAEAKAQAERQAQEQREAAWVRRLGLNRADEARRMAEAQRASEQARSAHLRSREERDARMTPQQRAIAEKCRRMAENPKSTARCM